MAARRSLHPLRPRRDVRAAALGIIHVGIGTGNATCPRHGPRSAGCRGATCTSTCSSRRTRWRRWTAKRSPSSRTATSRLWTTPRSWISPRITGTRSCWRRRGRRRSRHLRARRLLEGLRPGPRCLDRAVRRRRPVAGARQDARTWSPTVAPRFNGSPLEAAHHSALDRGSVQCEPQHLLTVMLEDKASAVDRTLRRQGWTSSSSAGVDAAAAAHARFGDARARQRHRRSAPGEPGVKAVLDHAWSSRGRGVPRGRRGSSIPSPASTTGGSGPSTPGSASRDRPAPTRVSTEVTDDTRRFRLMTVTGASSRRRRGPAAGPGRGARRGAAAGGAHPRPAAEEQPRPERGAGGRQDGLRRGAGPGHRVKGVPSAIGDKHVFSLDVGSLVAGTKYRGEFEERVQLLLDGIASAKGSIILFIESSTRSRGPVAPRERSMRRASSSLCWLAASSTRSVRRPSTEYREHIARDGALERRFQPVYVGAPAASCRDAPWAAVDLRGIPRCHDLRRRPRGGCAHQRPALPGATSADKAIELIDEAASQRRAEQAASRGRYRGGDRGERSAVGGERTAVVGPDDVRRVVDEWVGSDGHDGWTSRVYGRRGVVRRILRRVGSGRPLTPPRAGRGR